MSVLSIVAGVDVGGPRKGYHAVALRAGRYLDGFASTDAHAIAAWCARIGALRVGVDAPCRWRGDGPQRSSERALAAAGIRCFASPTRAAALAHEALSARAGKAGWYGWMFQGEQLYAALTPAFPLYAGGAPGPRCCFETFPHAVACALAGSIVPARQKNRLRRDLLRAAGIAAERLRNIDEVDAALCALAAHAFEHAAWRGYGDDEDGWIVVPATPPCR